MNIPTITRSAPIENVYPLIAPKTVAEPLAEENKQEVLHFLSRRPFNTIILSGWILDHGIVSPKHRGTFYGCRNENGDLIGVAMIGKNLLFEAYTDGAIAAFAECAQDCPDVRMIFAEEKRLNTFWRHYRGEAQMPKVSRHRLIRSSQSVINDIDIDNELRIATGDDLDQIVKAHAEMVWAETGVDPLADDADGFRMRCAERIDKGRVWVWTKGSELIFKTDIVSVTPEATYLEGLWVNPEYRGSGYCTRGLTAIAAQLLSGSNTLCGFLDVENTLATSLYRKSGFTEVGEFAKMYI